MQRYGVRREIVYKLQQVKGTNLKIRHYKTKGARVLVFAADRWRSDFLFGFFGVI